MPHLQIQGTVSGNTTSGGAGFQALSSGTVTLAGGPNITISQDGNAVSFSAAAAAGAQTGISGISNSETMYTSGTVKLSELANITIRSTTGQNFQFSVAAQSVQTQGITADELSVGLSTGGNTLGTSTVQTGQRLVFHPGNNFTISQGTGAGSTTLTMSVVNEQLGLSNIGNTSGSTGTVNRRLVLAGGNNITLSGSTDAALSSATITISAFNQSVQTDAITVDQVSMGVSTGGNTAGNTTVQTGNRMVFVGSNMVSLSQTTGAGSTTITFNATQSVQTQGITVDELSIGVSTGGNTAGNTTVQTGQRMVFVGTDNISLSQGTGAGSSTISIRNMFSSATSVSSVSNANAVGADNSRHALEAHIHEGVRRIGVSSDGGTAGSTTVVPGSAVQLVATDGATYSQSSDANSNITITLDPGPKVQSWQNFNPWAANAHVNVGDITNRYGTLGLFPLNFWGPFPGVMTANTFNVWMIQSGSTATMSLRFTSSLFVGIYTANASSLSLLNSVSTSWGSNAANANLSTAVAGSRWVTIHSSAWSSQPVFTRGNYFVGTIMLSSSNSNQTAQYLDNFLWATNSSMSGTVGVSQVTDSTVGILPWAGYYSNTTTGAFPASIGSNNLNRQGNALHAIHFLMNQDQLQSF